MRQAFGVGVLLALLPVVAVAESRVGVVVVGRSASSVDAAQAAVEAKVAQTGAVVRGVKDLPTLLGGDASAPATGWASDAAARSAFDAALAEAKKAYFSDLMPQASTKLDEAAAILERSQDVPGTIRVKVPMWRAAVALRKKQKDAAVGEVNVALLLVPNLEPEPNSPPPVVQLLAEVRAKTPKPFKLQLVGVPANAVVKIDDVVLSPSGLAVSPGPHVLDVIAPGHRPFNQSFEANKDMTLVVSLAPALAASWEKLFEGIAGRGEIGDAEKKSLEALASREKLDGLVIVALEPELRAAMWLKVGDASFSSAPDVPAVAAWAASQLQKAIAASTPRATPAATATPTPAPTAVAMLTPAPTATPSATPVVAGTPERGSSSPVFAMEAGVAYARWDRTVDSASGGVGYQVPGLGGGGPRLRGQALFGSVAGELEIAYVQFGSLETEAPDDSDATVAGGSMLRARVAGGYRHLFGAKDERSTAVRVTVGGFLESYSAEDLENTKVFPSHERSGVDLRVGAEIPAGALSFLVEGGVVPFSTWSEDPDGATGDDPAPAVSPLWRLGLNVGVGSRGKLAFEYGGEIRSVGYSGAGTMQLAPVDAKRSEMLHLVGLSFRYRF